TSGRPRGDSGNQDASRGEGARRSRHPQREGGSAQGGSACVAAPLLPALQPSPSLSPAFGLPTRGGRAHAESTLLPHASAGPARHVGARAPSSARTVTAGHAFGACPAWAQEIK